VALLIVAAPAYLERHGRPRHAGELGEHRLLGYSNASGPLHLTGPDGAQISLRPAGPLSTNSGEAMLPALRAGLGIAMLPEFIVADDLAAGRLVTLLEGGPTPPVAVHLLTPPGMLRPARVEALIGFLAEQIRLLCAGHGPADYPRLVD